MFLVVLLAVGSFIGYASFAGANLDDSSKEFIDANIPRVIQPWDKQALLKVVNGSADIQVGLSQKNDRWRSAIFHVDSDLFLDIYPKKTSPALALADIFDLSAESFNLRIAACRNPSDQHRQRSGA